MDVPGFRLHPMKRDRKGEWAVTVRQNWRVTFPALRAAMQQTLI